MLNEIHMNALNVSDRAEQPQHHVPGNARDKVAYLFVKFLRFFADSFFAGRYGHRAVILETIAGVPGMVGGSLQYLKSLRRMESDHGWIHTLLQVAIIAEKLRAALAEPYVLNVADVENGDMAFEYHCPASIGIALINHQETTQGGVLRRADMAMYQAKHAGGNQVRFCAQGS